MNYFLLLVIAGFACLYSLVAKRLERTIVSGALVYVTIGFMCGPDGFGLIAIPVEGESLKILAELTLALVLFTDSANTNLRILPRIESIPTRLLLIGLPLTIALGFGIGWIIFDGVDVFEIALLAILLAPTDAALGKAVVTNEQVPESVRESLSLESGLNDGICVPVLLFFLALAAGKTGVNEAAGLAVMLPLQAIGIGLVVGVAGGLVGSFALKLSAEHRWIGGTWLQVPVIALALFCFAAAQYLGGSGFIASFVGGLVFGGLCQKHKQQYLEAAEGSGDVMAMITWFVSGSAVIGLSYQFLDWRVIVYAQLSLTLIRMLPVWLCLSGRNLSTDTKLFIGWFGPRGLASVVFAVIVLDENLPGGGVLMATAVWTILLSIVLHGLTAIPFSRWYGAKTELRGGEI